MSFEFFRAVKKEQFELANQLIKNGEDVFYLTPSESWSYLHEILCGVGRKTPVTSVQFLIEKGLNVNAIDCYGNTPLHYASLQENADALKILLENGAEKMLEHRNIDGVTPLKMTMERMPICFESVKVLLEFGANPDAKKEGEKSFREMLGILAGVTENLKDLVSNY